MNRRSFLTAGTALVGAATLAACAPGQTPYQVASTVLSDVAAIASSFGNIVPALATVANIPADVASKVGTAITDLQTVATALSGAVTQGAAQDIVQQVMNDVNTVVATLATLSLPATIGAFPLGVVLQAATILLPVIEAAVGLVVKAPAAARAVVPGMSVDEARLILRANAYTR